ncbi:hypothetical protein [Pontibacter sp. H249]|uniref:hypothetical protein n=1 Tax=Pontibacter sp. H249 TaxID=3133420 RepID=UPI0030C3C114
MKKTLTTLIMLLAFGFCTLAQDLPTPPLPPTSANVADDAISKGNWLVGGSIASTGFNFSTDTYDLFINPKAGYFIGENFVLGSEVILGLTIFDGGTNFQYGITPFGRYYYTQGGGPSGRIFQEIAFGIAGSSIKDNEQDEPVSLLVGVRGGYAHFIAQNVALEAILGYTYIKADIDSDTGSGGLGISLGFSIYLPGRQ